MNRDEVSRWLHEKGVTGGLRICLIADYEKSTGRRKPGQSYEGRDFTHGLGQPSSNSREP